MKLISYARVSTDDKGQLPETQLLAIRHYAAAYSHEIVKEFIDEGISGNTVFLDRPNGTEILTMLERKEADGILVHAIDRFSRRDPFKVNDELEWFKSNNVQFLSVSEPFLNTDSEFKQIVQFMITWFASYFRKQLIVKVKAGMARAVEQGTKSGKPIGKPPASQEIKQKILSMAHEGNSLREIARQTGLSLGGVHLILHPKPKKPINTP